jgi:hypothetical protein
MKHITLILALLIGVHVSVFGQSRIVKDFKPVCDSLASLTTDRSGICGKIVVKNIMKRGGCLDFYFTESLGDYPWYREDTKWLKNTLKSLFPESYQKYKVGEIYSRNVRIDHLVTPRLTYDGKPADNRHKVKSPSDSKLIINRIGQLQPSMGLDGRHIALWQSHGRYYDVGAELWQWQRPCLFQTCEDMFTQGFVLPYLVPMLENAGAYVLLPRERDIQHNEVIADNDPSCGARGTATYKEKGKWSDAGNGFADTKATYIERENPFEMGSARQAMCVSPSSKATASITWTPDIQERGEYAVYISYKTLPSSTPSAHYTVHHLGGTSEFIVNQKMGGSTWVYLGTFEFAQGSDASVTLDNSTPDGYRMEVGAVVTADAVRFGGGMGNIVRSRKVDPSDTLAIVAEPTVSGLPRSAEAARYWLQWAGADTTVYYQNLGENDYKDDFMSRGDWVEWISRGSRVNPGKKGGLGIPVDLSLGFHTDAGVTPDDATIGTLAIYTYKSEGKTKLPAGENRQTSRMLAEMVQSQIVDDIRSEFDTLWNRRSIWDRGYRESRTPSCPSMLLELLSHQNFADMKYGLDPEFRFTVSRAIYKGMLKYLSNRFGEDYVVQPLPVNNIAVEFCEETAHTGGSSAHSARKDNGQTKVIVSWSPVADPLEPTANPDGYIVYRRIGDGAFDHGTIVNKCRYETEITPGEVVSFKVAAYNEGGIGFPSETVSIGLPESHACENAIQKALVVNNFDRISGPAYFDGPERAGFDSSLDSGVADRQDITFIGEMYNFRRSDEWITNSRPGFGASYSDKAGCTIAGNTFDYASVHGKAILEAGYAFYSCSNERFASDSIISSQAWAVDLVCGKQVTTPKNGSLKYTVFSEEMQEAIRRQTKAGVNFIVSGAYIGTDVWDSIYPISGTDTYSHETDSTCKSFAEFQKESAEFATKVLGYKFVTNQASRKGAIKPAANRAIDGLKPVEIVREMNADIYCIESPDGIAPASKNGHIIYRYTDSEIPAAVAHQGEGYRCVSLGFPIETIEDSADINTLIQTILEYFKK